MDRRIGRRRFIRQLGAGTALLAGAAAGIAPTLPQTVAAVQLGPQSFGTRRNASYRLRKSAAQLARKRPAVEP
jgi:hypothetical protein